MCGRLLLRGSVVVVGLLVARTAAADPITFTGNVAQDFNVPGAVTLQDPDNQLVAQPDWMTQNGLVSGWNIKNISLYYNQGTDTMYVGVNTHGIAGNVDGNGTPGSPDPRLTAAGGSDPANFGGDKAMAVAFAPLTGPYNRLTPPTPTIVAGVSGANTGGVKTQAGTGLDGFSVAHYVPTPGVNSYNSLYQPLVTNFGSQISAGMGNLAFDPSAQHPGFEFTVTNFSKILGADPLHGLVVYAQDGSVDSIITGKDTFVPNGPAYDYVPQELPEPATWALWTGLAGGAAWRYRRRRAQRSSA